MQTKTFLFDFDGTLVDSMPTYAGVMLRILDECGVSYGDDLVKIITPLGFKDTAKYYIKMGVQLPYEEIVRRMFLAQVRPQAELKREKVAKVTSEGGAGDKTVKKQPVVKKAKVGRNDPCPCGSGKKYKNCCLDKDLQQ